MALNPLYQTNSGPQNVKLPPYGAFGTEKAIKRKSKPKKKTMKKKTVSTKADKAMDKKLGIKEGSAKDLKMDNHDFRGRNGVQPATKAKGVKKPAKKAAKVKKK